MYPVVASRLARRNPTIICTSTLASARTFLRRAFGNEPKTFVRFLDLPTEIRLMVYAEVFHYDGTLEFLNPNLTATAPRKVLKSVAYDRQTVLDFAAANNKDEALNVPTERRNVTGLSGQILSLLLTNRQIFEEAMSVFYNINTFQANDIQGLVRMLRFCGERRRAHFSRVEINKPCYAGVSATRQAFDLLAKIKKLQHVAVYTTDRFDFKAEGAAKSPWIDLLCESPLRSFECLGDCPKIQAYVREKLSQMEKADEQVTVTKEKKSAKPRKRSKKSESMVAE
jgi:hypothetical protein